MLEKSKNGGISIFVLLSESYKKIDFRIKLLCSNFVMIIKFIKFF